MHDEASRRRVAGDFRANLVVEAGAGTGKTTLLVERAFRAIAAEGMRADQLVLVTFMERASEEIRERLAQRLQLALGDAEGAAAARIRAALDHLEQAVITTIHGLGQRILTEFSGAAKVPIGFTVLDGYDRQRLWAECWRAWLTSPRPPETEEVLEALLTAGESLNSLEAMAEEVSEWDEIPSMSAEPAALAPFFAAWRDRFESWLEVSAGAARNGEADPGRMQVRTIWEHLRWITAMDATTKTRALMTWSLSLHPKGNQKQWHPKKTLKQQKELIQAFREALRELTTGYARWMLARWLLVLADDLIPYWRNYRWQRGALGFDDLLREARDLLRRDLDVRRILYQRWRLILVDEFQDTDPVQSEILFRLAEAPEHRDWRTDPVPPGRLFLVGDVKQSIYRFRGADVETFQSMREKVVQDGGAVLKVEQNFRSDEGILTFVNEFFRSRMPDRPDPERPYLAFYDPLVASRHQGDQPRVLTRILPGAAGADQRRQMEAEATSEIIARAISQQWPVWDRESHQLRPVRYRDIAVLMPNRTGIEWYRDLFQRRGIPLASMGGVGFFHQDEVRGFAALLSLLADPDDEVAWLAFFLSPWVGASHPELEAYRDRNGAFGPGGENAPGPLGQWYRILSQWLAERDGWLPVDVLDALADISGLLPLLNERGDVQALANLAKLREMARVHGGAWGFGGFEEWLRNRVDAGENESEGVVEDFGDAVQLSTVHQAKGLEWPMCVVTNWHLETRGLPHLLRDPSGRTAAWRTAKFMTPEYEALADAARQREGAEQLRLLYVAMTRPRDYLVLVESADEKNELVFGRTGVLDSV